MAQAVDAPTSSATREDRCLPQKLGGCLLCVGGGGWVGGWVGGWGGGVGGWVGGWVGVCVCVCVCLVWEGGGGRREARVWAS